MIVRRMILGGLAAAMLCGGTASAATFKPTRFDDPEPGKCKPKDCSLREAIRAANKRDGADTVVLGKGHFKMSLPDDGNDDAGNGDFDVVDVVDIRGAGAKKTIVDGEGVDGVFAFLTFSKHSLSDLTVTGGASDNGGGGITVGPSKLKLANLIVKHNSSSNGGGGLRSVATNLTITNSTFSGNTGLTGGGILIPAGSVGVPKVTIKGSTLSGNGAALGGGLYADGTNSVGANDDPVVNIENSTVAGNAVDVSGGGVAAINGAMVAMDNTSVGFNTADADNSGGGSGGGIYQSTAATFAFTDSVLDQNTVGSTGDDAECSGTFTSAGDVYLIAPGCVLGGFGVSSPTVKPLANNGGPTKTLALVNGSAAEGLALTCPKRDQRGEKRPADCDSGAYEHKPK